MRPLLIALFCCLIYSAHAQTLFTSDSFPGKYFYLGHDNEMRLYPPCDRCDGDTIYGSTWGFQVWNGAGDTVRMDPFKKVRYAHQLDTVPVWRMVGDTVHVMASNMPVATLRLRKLWEVREWHNTREGVNDWGACFNCEWKDYPRHVKYMITRTGMPLLFGWVVIEGDVLGVGEPQTATIWTYKINKPDTAHSGFYPPKGITLTVDTAAPILYTGWTSTTQAVGPGVMVNPDKRYEQSIMLDWKWLPRRLRKRFTKFYGINN